MTRSRPSQHPTLPAGHEAVAAAVAAAAAAAEAAEAAEAVETAETAEKAAVSLQRCLALPRATVETLATSSEVCAILGGLQRYARDSSELATAVSKTDAGLIMAKATSGEGHAPLGCKQGEQRRFVHNPGNPGLTR